VDTLRIVEFAQAHRLQKAGYTLFRQPDTGAGETKVEDVAISQGFLEMSNVDYVKMMTEMIEVLRGYESYQKVIQAADETYAKAINEVGTI
jgi:flagellar basal-body rod protein FlgG